MRSAMRNIPACTGSTWLSRTKRMPSRASSSEMSLLSSGPVAMRLMIERITAAESGCAVRAGLFIMSLDVINDLGYKGSAIRRVLRAVRGNLSFQTVAKRQQLLLGDNLLTAVFLVELEDPRQNDGIHRAGLFAEPAVDALEQIDIVARGASCAVRALFRFDTDATGRTDGLTQLAGDAALLAVRVSTQRVQAAETRRLRGLLLRVTDGNLSDEQVFSGYREPAQQFPQQKNPQEMFHGSKGFHYSSFRCKIAGGKNHFQRSSRIWIMPSCTRSGNLYTGS